MKSFPDSGNSQKAQASLETMLLIGGIILIAIIVLVMLLSLMSNLQSNTTPAIQDVNQQVRNLG